MTFSTLKVFTQDYCRTTEQFVNKRTLDLILMKGSHSERIVVLHTQKTNIVVCWKLVKREEEGDCDNADVTL